SRRLKSTTRTPASGRFEAAVCDIWFSLDARVYWPRSPPARCLWQKAATSRARTPPAPVQPFQSNRRSCILKATPAANPGCSMSDEQRNVFGDPIAVCSVKPMTGFYRTGCCETGAEDTGVHTVCIEATAEFLAFSRARGNDLSTPRPEFGFPGL